MLRCMSLLLTHRVIGCALRQCSWCWLA